MQVRPPLVMASLGSSWREALSPEQAAILRSVLGRLTQRSRRALWVALYGLTKDEAAELLGISRQAAYKREERAFAELGSVLRGDELMAELLAARRRAALVADRRTAAAAEEAAAASKRLLAAKPPPPLQTFEPVPRAIRLCNYEHCPTPLKPLRQTTTKHMACIRAAMIQSKRAHARERVPGVLRVEALRTILSRSERGSNRAPRTTAWFLT